MRTHAPTTTLYVDITGKLIQCLCFCKAGVVSHWSMLCLCPEVCWQSSSCFPTLLCTLPCLCSLFIYVAFAAPGSWWLDIIAQLKCWHAARFTLGSQAPSLHILSSCTPQPFPLCPGPCLSVMPPARSMQSSWITFSGKRWWSSWRPDGNSDRIEEMAVAVGEHVHTQDLIQCCIKIRVLFTWGWLTTVLQTETGPVVMLQLPLHVPESWTGFWCTGPSFDLDKGCRGPCECWPCQCT